MPWGFDVSDENLSQYLPDVLADVGPIAAYERLEGGTYNTGVQARLQDGRDVIVKVSPPSTAPGLAYEDGLLLTEADYFRRTLPLGVPVPEVLAVGTGVIPGRHHLVMSKVPGRPWWGSPEPSGAERALLRRQLGRAVALAHQAPCQGFGYMFGREGRRGELGRTPLPPLWPPYLTMPFASAPNCHGHRTKSVVSSTLSAPPWLRSSGQCWSIGTSGTAISWSATTPRGGWSPGSSTANVPFRATPCSSSPPCRCSAREVEDDRFVVDDAFLSGYCEVAGPLVPTGALRARLALYRTHLYLVMLIEVTPRQISGEHKHWRQTNCSAILGRQLSLLEAQLG